MGGLFSSSSPTPEPARVSTYYEYPRQSYSYPRPSYSYPSPPVTPPKPTRAATYSDYSFDLEEKSWIYGESFHRQAASPRTTINEVGSKTRDNYLLSDTKKFHNLKDNLLAILDSSEASIYLDAPIKETLSTHSPNYCMVKKSFMRTTQKYYVAKVEEVFNPYLRVLFLLRAMQYKILNGYDTEKKFWFHGTKRGNIDSIVLNNFNWRMHGKARGNIFGKGVSFSPISDYAANYCDKNGKKVMILVESLFNHMCQGDTNMTIPPFVDSAKKIRYDTSGKPDGNVCVKYYDDEFYPRYIVHFVNKYVK